MRTYYVVITVLALFIFGCEKKPADAPARVAAESATPKPSVETRHEVTITRAEYGEAWPFTVESGVLKGTPTGRKLSDGTELAEVTFATGGRTYYVNGTAKGTQRYAELDDIWAAGSSIAEEVPLKKNIGPIIERGLKLAQGVDLPFAAPKPAPSPVAVVGGPVRCDQFEIAAEFQSTSTGSVRRVEVSIKTDLPENTQLMVSIGRSFRNSVDNEEYLIDYLEERSTVSRWRAGKVVELDQAKWQEELDDKRATFRKLGQKFSMKDLDTAVTIDFVVPVNQSDKRFGDGNANLTGAAVEDFDGLRIVDRAVRLEWPVTAR